eukprot:3499503-Rhodomonas_salina.5
MLTRLVVHSVVAPGPRQLRADPWYPSPAIPCLVPAPPCPVLHTSRLVPAVALLCPVRYPIWPCYAMSGICYDPAKPCPVPAMPNPVLRVGAVLAGKFAIMELGLAEVEPIPAPPPFYPPTPLLLTPPPHSADRCPKSVSERERVGWCVMWVSGGERGVCGVGCWDVVQCAVGVSVVVVREG